MGNGDFLSDDNDDDNDDVDDDEEHEGDSDGIYIIFAFCWVFYCYFENTSRGSVFSRTRESRLSNVFIY